MIDIKMYPTNSEVNKWKNKIKDNRKGFDFIEINFLVDMREAKNRYKEEYKNDVDNINTLQIPFNQWLDMKKYKALKFEEKYNEYNLDKK